MHLCGLNISHSLLSFFYFPYSILSLSFLPLVSCFLSSSSSFLSFSIYFSLLFFLVFPSSLIIFSLSSPACLFSCPLLNLLITLFLVLLIFSLIIIVNKTISLSLSVSVSDSTVFFPCSGPCSLQPFKLPHEPVLWLEKPSIATNSMYFSENNMLILSHCGHRPRPILHFVLEFVILAC